MEKELDCSIRLGGVEDISTIDWYGKVSTVFHCAGCNFRCQMCFNHSLIPMDSGELYEDSKVYNIIQMNSKLVDSIVLTGGEPTVQPVEELINICGIAKSFDLEVMLDTNGSNTDKTEYLLQQKLVDRIALDVKAPLTPYNYTIATMVSGSQYVPEVFKTMKLAKKYGVELEVRTTVVPELSSKEGQIVDIANCINNYADVYYLQEFDNTDPLNPVLKLVEPPDREDLLYLGEIAKQCGVKEVYVKTREKGLEKV